MLEGALDCEGCGADELDIDGVGPRFEDIGPLEGDGLTDGGWPPFPDADGVLLGVLDAVGRGTGIKIGSMISYDLLGVTLTDGSNDGLDD